MNNLLSATASFLDNLALSGIVVVIGVGMVFIILALLILLVNLLKHVDSSLNHWDEMMFYYRAKKADKKALFTPISDDKENAISDIKSAKAEKKITSIEYKTQMAECKAKFNQLKADAGVQVADIDAKYNVVKNIRAKASAAIKALKADELESYKSAVSAVSSPADKAGLKKARITSIDAMNGEIKVVKAAMLADIELALMGITANESAPVSVAAEGVTSEIIAAITAAIAIVTATEAEARRITFKVRSIKEVR